MARLVRPRLEPEAPPVGTPSAVLSTTLRSVTTGGFQFREHEVAARELNPRHAHDYHCAGFLIDGLGGAELGRESWTVRPGCLNVIPGGVYHVERFRSRRIRWRGRPPEVRDARREARRHSRPELKASPANEIATRIYRELRLADDASALSLHGLGLELLAVLARGSASAGESGRPAWIGRAEELLRASALEKLSLDDLAAEVEVHPTHLSRVFRRVFGVPVGEYVRRLRIDHATALLARDDLSLAQIASESGFADQAHFTRVFKRRLGITPGRYRVRLGKP
jgi:AraC family transcriptional regulator